MNLFKYAILAVILMPFNDAVSQTNQIKHSLDSILYRIPGKKGERFAQVTANQSVALFLYAPRDKDLQQPHTRDEFYIVATGTGTFSCDNTSVTFKQGDLLFAPAGKAHRFENFSDDLTVWVIFYGEEKGPEDLVKKFIQSINKHNVEDIILMQSDDFVLKDADGNEMMGRDKLRQAWTDYFALVRDYKIEIETVVRSKDELVVLGYAGGASAKNTNKVWRLPVSIRAKVKGNNISLWQIYSDTKIPFDLMNKP